MRDARTMAVAMLGLLVGMAASPSPAAAQTVEPAAADPASETVTQLAEWVRAAGNNRGLPFVIVDKVSAEVFVFAADGQLQGAAPALLGFARGDDSAPGIGDRDLSAIRPGLRTTPAGRFLAAFGPAKGKDKVLWVDYATAISLHPVAAVSQEEQRLKRLKSPSPKDNRITYGCINVSAAFYQNVVRKTVTDRGVVYILPETKPLGEVFPTFGIQTQASRATTDGPAKMVGLDGGPESRITDAAAASAGSDAVVLW